MNKTSIPRPSIRKENRTNHTMSNCQMCKESQLRSGPGMLCGRCSHEKYKENERPKLKLKTKDERRTAKIRKFFAAPRPKTSVKKLALQCPKKHRWFSEYNPGGFEESKARTPLCPKCASGFIESTWLKVEITDQECTDHCKAAIIEDICKCSCGGSNHGSISVLREMQAQS